MPDLQKVLETKEKIISIIKLNGPSFPSKIAREAGISPLFTSAFLSELVSERRLKLSDMKVGSSPIYYMIGQEKMLENFTNYLNGKEKEAFFKLKDSFVLNDEELDPSLRVALRKIKDFAIPVTVRVNDAPKIFWRYFQTKEEQAKELVRDIISPEIKKKTEERRESKKEVLKEIKLEIKKTKEIEPILNSPQKQKESKKEKIMKLIQPDLSDSIKEYLKSKDIQVIEEMLSKKKEYTAKVKTALKFGEQEFYLIFKDKKKISQNDLTIAVQKAQTAKMPAILISTGELDKKAAEYLSEWKNMIKFEKLNP